MWAWQGSEAFFKLARAAKIIEYLDKEGYLIEMGCYQKKFNFDFFDELKDVIFERFSELVKVA